MRGRTLSLAGRIGRVSRLFAEKPREACDLRVRPLRRPARMRVCCRSSCDGLVNGGARRVSARSRRSAARTASSSATCSARSTATSPARRSGPTIPTGCGRRSRCASCSARSAAGRSRGRCLARRSRPPARLASPLRRPGVSVSPCARIETNTHSAAMLKIRSSCRDLVGEHEQRERHRRHALRPEPGHERRPVGGAPRAEQRQPDRHRPRDSSVTSDDRDRRPAVAEQPVERQQRAEHDEHAELDDLDDVLGARLERRRAGPGAGCRA